MTINGQPLTGEVNIGFGETISITLTAQNLSAQPATDVVVCSNITNQCYNLGLVGAGQSKSTTVTYTAPTRGLILDGVPTVYTPESGVIEGATVLHERDLGPVAAPAIVRLPDGHRVGARLADAALAAELSEQPLVGRAVTLVERDGTTVYELA